MQTSSAACCNEDLERIITLPLEYMTVAMNDGNHEGREAALILTEEDILNIKRYEKYSLNLPTTLERVENQLGFTSSKLPGLEPRDMLVTYQAINSHAKTWATIESEVKLTGVNIDAFAAQFTATGNILLKAVDRMDILDQLDLSVGDLTLEQVAAIKPIPLNAKDLRIRTTLSIYLKNTAEDINRYQKNAQDLTRDITTFARTLNEDLIPIINDKIVLARRSDLEQQTAELEKDIARLTLDIEQKREEYAQAKKNITWGGFGGPIGIAISGGIFGSQAEKARKAKNKLIAEKNAKVLELKEKRPLAAAIRSLEVLFEDMNIRMEDAQESSTHLRDLWAMLAAYVNRSAESLASITDAQQLFEFVLQFEAVVRPWVEIKGMTQKFLYLFESALMQFKLEHVK
jgi:hypothetical protein